MLVAAVEKSDDKHLETVSVEHYEVHKRMPRTIEKHLMMLFEQKGSRCRRCVIEAYEKSMHKIALYINYWKKYCDFVVAQNYKGINE